MIDLEAGKLRREYSRPVLKEKQIGGIGRILHKYFQGNCKCNPKISHQTDTYTNKEGLLITRLTLNLGFLLTYCIKVKYSYIKNGLKSLTLIYRCQVLGRVGSGNDTVAIYHI